MNSENLPLELVHRLNSFALHYIFESWGIDEEGELIFYDHIREPMCVREFREGTTIKTQFVNFQNQIDKYSSYIGFIE